VALLTALGAIAAGVVWWLKPWVPDIVLSAPGKTGMRIDRDGVFANYFPAALSSPAVVLLGGSSGGITHQTNVVAIALQSEGFSVLAPSYFGAPGEPGSLERIPLETFDRAIAWLARRPEVDASRMAVVGHSKGAEAALLIGTRHPELRAVVAAAPSSVVWAGIDWNNPINPDASWTAKGRPLAFLPYPLFRPWRSVGDGYTDGLEKLHKHRDALIRVERTKAPVLLVCGERDTLWPSCRMARQLRARADQKHGPPVTVLALPHAGHSAFGPRLPNGDPDLHDRWSGGTAADNNAGRAQGWPVVLAFLRDSLAL
jgi:dienelactone hydrolase